MPSNVNLAGEGSGIRNLYCQRFWASVVNSQYLMAILMAMLTAGWKACCILGMWIGCEKVKADAGIFYFIFCRWQPHLVSSTDNRALMGLSITILVRGLLCHLSLRLRLRLRYKLSFGRHQEARIFSRAILADFRSTQQTTFRIAKTAP